MTTHKEQFTADTHMPELRRRPGLVGPFAMTLRGAAHYVMSARMDFARWLEPLELRLRDHIDRQRRIDNHEINY